MEVLKKFRRNERGNVALLMGICSAAMIIAGGAAVDYSRSINLQAEVQAAADAAVLAAAIPLKDDDTVRKSTVNAAFFKNFPRKDVTPTLTVKVIGRKVTLDVKADLPTTLLNIAGPSKVSVNVHSEAMAGGASDAEITMLLDMSASMGIASTEAERTKLRAITKPMILASNPSYAAMWPDGCAFACHQSIGYEPKGKTSYDIARANGIRLREDDLTDASKILIDTVTGGESETEDLKIGVMGFSDDPEWLQVPTTKMTDVKSSLSSFSPNARQDSHIDDALKWARKEAKDKSTTENRFMVLVTDGVGGGRKGMKWKKVDTKHCDDIKNDGVTLYVIETKYEDESGEFVFDKYVKPFFNQITPTLQACASDGKYFLANEKTEIENALKDVADDILGSGKVRLTQ